MSVAHTMKRALGPLFIMLLVCFVATGCSQQLGQQAETEEETGPTSRTFMAQMNESADALQGTMDAFTDATSRQDLVSMKMQADAAAALIEQMGSIEAPDELTDLRQKYVDGCTQLKDVLAGYLDLYTEIDSSTTRNPFDYDSYSDRLAQLQSQYDAAVQALEDADKSATEM